MYRSVILFNALLVFLTLLLSGHTKRYENPNTTREHRTMMTAGFNFPGKSNTAAGSITGRVIFKGETPDRQKIMIIKDTDVCSVTDQYDESLLVSKNNGIQNAVVYLTGVDGGKPLSSLGKKFIIDQRGCRYKPHVLIMPVKVPLEILNDDGILHNFHTFCRKNRPKNMAQPKFRKEMEMSFKHPEFIQVRCDIHGWMNGWIIVVDQPYYTLSDEDGNFSIKDIPPGIYTLSCWQEKLGEQSKQITVSAGNKASTQFTYREQRK